MATSGDAADDVAIYIDSQNPENSLIIGTDKKAGISLYTIQGKLKSSHPFGRINNIDIRQGKLLNWPGENKHIIGATNRTQNSLDLYQIDFSGTPKSKSSYF